MTRHTQVHITVRNKVRDVGGGQEDERNGQVLDERNVQAVRTLELDVGAVQQRQTRLIEPTCISISTYPSWELQTRGGLASSQREAVATSKAKRMGDVLT